MSFLKDLQKLNVAWKRVIVFAVIVVLAVPLLVFIGNSFQKRTKRFQEEKLFKELKLPGSKQEQGTEDSIFEELKRMGEELKESTTSTNIQ